MTLLFFPAGGVGDAELDRPLLPPMPPAVLPPPCAASEPAVPSTCATCFSAPAAA